MELQGDFLTTVRKALTEIDPNWKKYPGLIVGGTHLPHDTEDIINKIKKVREAGLPFLGICWGHQLAAIEYARNVLKIKNATSQEFGKGTFIVKKRKDLKVGLHEGESYWNNYEVTKEFESAWGKPSNFITVQYHPEYQSSKEKPHKILKQFLNYAKMAM